MLNAIIVLQTDAPALSLFANKSVLMYDDVKAILLAILEVNTYKSHWRYRRVQKRGFCREYYYFVIDRDHYVNNAPYAFPRHIMRLKYYK